MWRLQFEILSHPIEFPVVAEAGLIEEVWHDTGGREYGLGRFQRDFIWAKIHSAGVYRVDVSSGYAQGCPNDGVSPRWFRELFFHIIAPCVLQRYQWDCLHASAVLTDAVTIAFCGPTRRGKSTLARAYCDRGHIPYADDALPFLIENGEVFCARIPQRLRLRKAAANRFAELPIADALANGNGSVTCDLRGSLRPLRAIYWLDPMNSDDSRTAAEIDSIPASESFQLLMGQAHCMSVKDAECNRKTVRNYLDLAKNVPLLRLSFPRNLDHLSATLDLLDQHQSTLST
jgi:hypothetical protein